MDVDLVSQYQQPHPINYLRVNKGVKFRYDFVEPRDIWGVDYEDDD